MVVDASVVVSHLVPHDVHHAASRAWLTRHLSEGGLVIAPALLLLEIAGAVARRTGAPRLAQRAVEAVMRLEAETLARQLTPQRPALTRSVAPTRMKARSAS